MSGTSEFAADKSQTSARATSGAGSESRPRQVMNVAVLAESELGSEAQRERRKRILDATLAIASKGGYEAVQMRAVAERADVAVGTLYRYFPSKDAIIAAMAAHDMAEMDADFAAIRLSDDPLPLIREKIRFKIEGCADRGLLWAEITAAAIRKPEIREAAGMMEGTIIAFLIAIFAGVTRRSEAEARQRYEGQAQMLVMLVKAMAMRTCQCGPASPALSAQVVAVLDRVLSEISNDKAEG